MLPGTPASCEYNPSSSQPLCHAEQQKGPYGYRRELSLVHVNGRCGNTHWMMQTLRWQLIPLQGRVPTTCNQATSPGPQSAWGNVILSVEHS